MAVYRMYTGPDGQSHFEEIKSPAPLNETSHLDAKEAYIRTWPADFFHDWHPSRQRQYAITLSGQLEIEIGDGTKIVFGPGDAYWGEDLTGEGHTGRVVGGQPRVALVVVLASG